MSATSAENMNVDNKINSDQLMEDNQLDETKIKKENIDDAVGGNVEPTNQAELIAASDDGIVAAADAFEAEMAAVDAVIAADIGDINAGSGGCAATSASGDDGSASASASGNVSGSGSGSASGSGSGGEGNDDKGTENATTSNEINEQQPPTTAEPMDTNSNEQTNSAEQQNNSNQMDTGAAENAQPDSVDKQVWTIYG